MAQDAGAVHSLRRDLEGLSVQQLQRGTAHPNPATADALQRFHALLAPDSSSSAAADTPLSPILPAMRQLRELLQGVVQPQATCSGTEPGLAAALLEARIMDDLLRAAFESQQPTLSSNGPAVARDDTALAEAAIRAALHAALAGCMAATAASALGDLLSAPGSMQSMPVTAAAGGGSSQDGWAERLGSADLQPSAALEAADEGLMSRAAQQGEPYEADQDEGGLDWLDEEALQQQSREAAEGMARGRPSSWDGVAGLPERPDSRLQGPLGNLDFDEGASRPGSVLGDGMEGEPLEAALRGRADEGLGDMQLEAFMAFDNELGSSGELLEPDSLGDDDSSRPFGELKAGTFGSRSPSPSVTAAQGISEAALAEQAGGLVSARAEGWPSAAADAASQPPPSSCPDSVGQEQPAAEVALSESAQRLCDAMAAAARSSGRHRAALLQRAAAEAGVREAAEQLAAFRAMLARYEWVHEPVLAAAGVLGPPVELPPAVRDFTCHLLSVLAFNCCALPDTSLHVRQWCPGSRCHQLRVLCRESRHGHCVTGARSS